MKIINISILSLLLLSGLSAVAQENIDNNLNQDKSSSDQNSKNQNEEISTCPVCLENFEEIELVTLACGEKNPHKLCYECLLGYRSSVGINKVLECPLCRAKIENLPGVKIEEILKLNKIDSKRFNRLEKFYLMVGLYQKIQKDKLKKSDIFCKQKQKQQDLKLDCPVQNSNFSFNNLSRELKIYFIFAYSKDSDLKKAISKFFKLATLNKSFNALIKDKSVQILFLKNYTDTYDKDFIKVNKLFIESLNQENFKMADLLFTLNTKDNKVIKFHSNHKIVFNDKAINEILMWATENNQLELVELLLKNGADSSYKSVFNSPLINACINNSTDMVKLLLKSGADVNYEDISGTTALSATDQDNHKIQELLVAANSKK